MTIKDCFGDGLVDGSKLLLFGREYSLLEIDHIEGNVYGITVNSGIKGEDDDSYVKVSAEHEVLVPSVKAKSEPKKVGSEDKSPPVLKSLEEKIIDEEATVLSAADFDDVVEPTSKPKVRVETAGGKLPKQVKVEVGRAKGKSK